MHTKETYSYTKETSWLIFEISARTNETYLCIQRRVTRDLVMNKSDLFAHNRALSTHSYSRDLVTNKRDLFVHSTKSDKGSCHEQKRPIRTQQSPFHTLIFERSRHEQTRPICAFNEDLLAHKRPIQWPKRSLHSKKKCIHKKENWYWVHTSLPP